MGRSRAGRIGGVCVALAAMLVGLSGCTGYSTYPKVEGASLADVNGVGMQGVIIEGLRYVASRRPLDEPYTVNLPQGMLQERMDVIVRNIEDEHARTLTRERADLPRVHVTRVWLRATRAEIDILRPVEGVSGPEGAPTYESYTLRVEGGWRRWKVIDARRWMVGTIPAPDPNWYGDAPQNPSLVDDEGAPVEDAPTTDDSSDG